MLVQESRVYFKSFIYSDRRKARHSLIALASWVLMQLVTLRRPCKDLKCSDLSFLHGGCAQIHKETIDCSAMWRSLSYFQEIYQEVKDEVMKWL